MSMMAQSNNNGLNEIPWVYPGLDFFEDKSVTHQSLGSQSTNSDFSTFSDESHFAQQSMDYQSSCDFLSPLMGMSYAEQTASDNYFCIGSNLEDPLDYIPFGSSLTAVNTPQPLVEPKATCFELTDLTDSHVRSEISSSVPSPMAQQPNPYFDWSFKTDNFPDIETSEVEQDLADVSSLESRSSLPTITTMFQTATISTPSNSTICKTEGLSNESTFPVSFTKKEKPQTSRPRQGRQMAFPEPQATTRQRQGRQVALWQFLYHTLQHPNLYNNMISWVDENNGIFEFSSKNKDSLARAWGAVKNNRCPMTYPKLARALRKYIEGDKFITKRKRKLQYVFRPEFLNQLRSGALKRPLSDADKNKIYEYSR